MDERDDDTGGGYGRPPKRHQFKKGESGNPRGRPRSGQSVPEIVARVRDEMIPILVNGKRKRVRLIEAALRHSIAACLKSGNPRHLEKLLEILEKYGITSGEVMAEQAKASAESAVRKIFSYFEKTHPDSQDERERDIEQEEAAIIARSATSRAALRALWEANDAAYGAARQTRLRLLIARIDGRKDSGPDGEQSGAR
jgi:hypothetical protein